MSEPDMQGQYAGCATRFMAWVVDRIILVATVSVVVWLGYYIAGVFGITLTNCTAVGPLSRLSNLFCWSVTLFLVAFALLFSSVYFIFFTLLAGQTPGKALLGVRIVRQNAEPMTLRVSIRRYLGYLFSFLALGLGFVAILLDNQRRAWHDSFAKTYVVYSWSARQNQPLVDRLTKKTFASTRKAGRILRKGIISHSNC